MIIYIESNFILEAALVQEESSYVNEIIELVDSGKIQLKYPLFALSEPFWTLVNRTTQRRNFNMSLTKHLNQLQRSSISKHQEITALLIRTQDVTSDIEKEKNERLIEITPRKNILRNIKMR